MPNQYVNKKFFKIEISDFEKYDYLNSNELIIYKYLKNEIEISKIYKDEEFIIKTDKQILDELNNIISNHTLRNIIKKLKDKRLIYSIVDFNSKNQYYRKLYLRDETMTFDKFDFLEIKKNKYKNKRVIVNEN